MKSSAKLLRVDVDDAKRPMHIARLCWLLRRAGFKPVWLSQRRSPGGKGWHLEVKVCPTPRSLAEVVALQCILGSDPAREACNVNRARMVEAGKVPGWWADRWNVLYAGVRHA